MPNLRGRVPSSARVPAVAHPWPRVSNHIDPDLSSTLMRGEHYAPIVPFMGSAVRNRRSQSPRHKRCAACLFLEPANICEFIAYVELGALIIKDPALDIN